jgi:hypothetical protein
LRIFDAVEGKHKASGVGTRRIRLEKVFNCQKLLRLDERDHSLVRGGLGDNRELLARLLPDSNSSLAACGYKALQAFVVPLAGDQDMVEATPPGPERLFHRMEPVQNIHEVSLDGSPRRLRRQLGAGQPVQAHSLLGRLHCERTMHLRRDAHAELPAVPLDR